MIGERDFTSADQEAFAAASGDRNPIHMDAIAARRTMAGSAVVHGIHTVLWGLDCLFLKLPELPPVGALKVSFDKMILVGDHVKAEIKKHDERSVRFDVLVDGGSAIRVEASFGVPQSNVSSREDLPLLSPRKPIDMTFEAATTRSGWTPYAGLPNMLTQMFPLATAVLGAHRVAGLACSSFLVGMVCPGLHSIYRSFKLETAQADQFSGGLQFRVGSSDARFGLLKLDVVGEGWQGTVQAHVRPEPEKQARFADLQAMIQPHEFNEARALIIGGSRGLGEIVAKILAAGGARVMISYAVGEADAKRVQDEIRSAGGSCEIIRYNVRQPPESQISPKDITLNQLYYFATSPIFGRKHDSFRTDRFEEFFRFYVIEFYNLCSALRSMGYGSFSALYPSSVAVHDRPPDMTEYSMAKAAGEILCADMQAFKGFGKISVHRLPRLPTDQTGSVTYVRSEDPVAVLLPIVREVHGNRSTTQ